MASQSNLDALLEKDEANQSAKRSERLSKPRLIADPTVSVADLMKILRTFIIQKECRRLLTLVVPAGHRTFNWRTPIDPEWCQRMSSLVFDMLGVAPNSKVQGKRLQDAIKKMLDGGDLKTETQHENAKYIDTCNLLIRLL